MPPANVHQIPPWIGLISTLRILKSAHHSDEDAKKLTLF